MNLLSALWARIFKKKPVLAPQDKVVRSVLDVTGMTWEGCESRVRSALLKVKGVVRADASYTRGVAEVEYIEGGASLEGMIQALNASGFSASPPRL